MLQIAIQIGSLLIVNGHVLFSQRVGILEEPGPEHLDIFLPHSCYQRHLLEELVIAMVPDEPVHDKLLGHHIVRSHHISACHQPTDG